MSLLNSNSGNKIIYGVAGIFGLKYLYGIYQSYRQSKENEKVGEDNSANIASQIHSENRANWTDSDKQVDLFRRITDYKKTKDAYKEVSEGKDILEDTRPHVTKGAYQQILNILGEKDGAIKATSQTAQDVQTNLSKFTWVIAKVDARIRKSPKAGSAVFTMRPNVIATAPGHTVVGIIDKASLKKNGGKLFFDTENSAYFLPILIFDKDGQHHYPAYVAVSSIEVVKDRPKELQLFLVSSYAYTQAYATAGIEKDNPLEGLTDVSKLLM